MCADNREGHEQTLFHVSTAVRPDCSPFKERDITSDFAMAENRWIEAKTKSERQGLQNHPIG